MGGALHTSYSCIDCQEENDHLVLKRPFLRKGGALLATLFIPIYNDDHVPDFRVTKLRRKTKCAFGTDPEEFHYYFVSLQLLKKETNIGELDLQLTPGPCCCC